ncbi:DUF7289 family protein [Natronomonas sp.]|uniref:DUF7289 family protein n=1 Tax=Natronomonas sp. TaxID=2184060 RepID=UPI002FC27900
MTNISRGQSEVIGVVLLFGLTILSISLIVAVGGASIGSIQHSAEFSSAEQSMTQLGAKSSLVALGESDSQRVELPNGEGSTTVNSTAGTMEIRIINKTGTVDKRTIELGAITYDQDGNTVAYQGGGVWKRTNGGSTMVSPPEFHYRGETLTLPLVNVTNDAVVSEGATVEGLDTTQVYPNAHQQNPNENSKVNVTVHSEYYEAWAEYFESRTDATATVDHDNRTATATLVPPPTPINIDSGVVGAGNLTLNGASNVEGDVSLGGEVKGGGAGGVSGDIEENVSENKELETAASKINTARSRLGGEPAPSDNSYVEAGTYFVSDDDIFSDDTTFDTSDGDIELFVDGDAVAEGTGGGPFAPPELDVVGDGKVEIYVDGEFDMNGQPTWGRDSQVDSLFVYSLGVDRITEFYGVIYTDDVDVAGAGGGGPSSTDLKGALISTADNIEASGQLKVEYDPALENIQLEEVETEFATLMYLHVTDNKVRVES